MCAGRFYKILIYFGFLHIILDKIELGRWLPRVESGEDFEVVVIRNGVKMSKLNASTPSLKTRVWMVVQLLAAVHR